MEEKEEDDEDDEEEEEIAGACSLNDVSRILNISLSVMQIPLLLGFVKHIVSKIESRLKRQMRMMKRKRFHLKGIFNGMIKQMRTRIMNKMRTTK